GVNCALFVTAGYAPPLPLPFRNCVGPGPCGGVLLKESPGETPRPTAFDGSTGALVVVLPPREDGRASASSRRDKCRSPQAFIGTIRWRMTDAQGSTMR